MATYRYDGEQELVFPTLGVVVSNGDTFDGPDGLTLDKVVLADVKKKATPVATPEPSEPVGDSADPVIEGEN